MARTFCLPFIASFCLLAGCDVYHSADRDYFNSNAIYGAPAATTSSLKAQITQTKCQPTKDLAGFDLQTKDDSSAVAFAVPDATTADAIVTLAHIRQRSPIDASVCAVSFKNVPTDSTVSPLLIQASQETVAPDLLGTRPSP